MPYALCPMPYALCPTLYALCFPLKRNPSPLTINEFKIHMVMIIMKPIDKII